MDEKLYTLYTTNSRAFDSITSINGIEYQIGKDGACEVNKAAAEKLLSIPGWYDTPQGKPVDDRVARREAFKAQQKLEEEKANEEPEGDENIPPSPNENDLSPEADEGSKSEDEWPDPTMEMPIDQLKEIADGYEVPYKGNVSKKTLVADINAAMYPEEE